MRNPLRILFTILAGSIPLTGLAETFADLEERVVEHELANGMRFLIFERREAPLVSMVIAVRVGSVNEVTNKTGLAHFMEHLAFAGTPTIGTTNYKAERKALSELDVAFGAYHSAKKQGADSATVAALYAEFKQKQDAAAAYVVGNELSAIYERNGGVGLNAMTGYNNTTYMVTLPSNRFELWCAIESDRLANSVFREFYNERDIIIEERRTHENNPYGVFYEEYNSVCYKAHPYGRPVIGHMSDIKNMRREDVSDFYETYYVPQHVTAAIAGDIKAREIIPLIEDYFGRIPAKPDPPELITEEPPQAGIRRVEVRIGKRPRLLMQFHTVPAGHSDEIALDLVGSVLGGGRTSRLYRALVEDRKLASSVYAYHSSGLYAGSIGFGGVPMEGVNPAELEEAVLEELAALKDKPITQVELDAARMRWQVRMYDFISSNLWMAYQLATYDQGNRGWRARLRLVEKAEQTTVEDLMKVAERYIDPDRRSVGLLEVAND